MLVFPTPQIHVRTLNHNVEVGDRGVIWVPGGHEGLRKRRDQSSHVLHPEEDTAGRQLPVNC